MYRNIIFLLLLTTKRLPHMMSMRLVFIADVVFAHSRIEGCLGWKLGIVELLYSIPFSPLRRSRSTLGLLISCRESGIWQDQIFENLMPGIAANMTRTEDCLRMQYDRPSYTHVLLYSTSNEKVLSIFELRECQQNQV